MEMVANAADGRSAKARRARRIVRAKGGERREVDVKRDKGCATGCLHPQNPWLLMYF